MVHILKKIVCVIFSIVWLNPFLFQSLTSINYHYQPLSSVFYSSVISSHTSNFKCCFDEAYLITF